MTDDEDNADDDDDDDDDDGGGGAQGACHCIQICAGNLLVQDCDISCADGCGVLIMQLREGEVFGFRNSDPPRLLRCRVHDGGDVGVCIESAMAVLTDCVIRGHTMSNIELLQSSSGTILTGCKIEGGDQAGLHCCERSLAEMTDCQIFGSGMAGLAASEGAAVRMCRCTIREGWEGGVMATGEGTRVTLDDCTVPTPGQHFYITSVHNCEENGKFTMY